MNPALNPEHAVPPTASLPKGGAWLAKWRRRWRVSFGRIPTSEDEIELVQSRIYLLPSGRGLFVIVTAILLLLVGVNYQLSLSYVVAFLLAGLMQVALLASYRNLRGVTVRAGRSPRCRKGETLSFPIVLTSPERPRTGLRLTAPCGKAHAVVGPLSAAADEVFTATLVFPASTRGVATLGRIVIDSRAPYGLIRAWSYVHFEWVGLVAPIAESPSPALPLAAGDEGELASRPQQQVAHDPDSLREYQAGDSLRRVAWKQVAKSGRWYTRTGDAGVRQEIELSWQAAPLDDTEARLSRINAWVARAHNENCAYSLVMPNGQLPMADGAQQYADALTLIAAYPHRPDEIRGLR